MISADGIHFGTGEEMDSGIFAILDPRAPTLLNEPEAQWHWAAVAARGSGLTMWRASPEKRPAQLGWSSSRYAREVFKGLDAHRARSGQYPGDVLLLNELNLDYERGDSRDDGGAWDTNPEHWPGLYSLLSTFLDGLLTSCRELAGDRGLTMRFWYPGWAPGHGETTPEIAALWVPLARHYDGICLHAYTTVEQVTETVLWYDQQFEDKPLFLGEWNTINFKGDRLAEEGKIRSRLRRLTDSIPRLSATYFIYAWAEDPHHEHDIKGNDARLALWDERTALPVDDWGAGVPGLPDPPPPAVPEIVPMPEPINPWQWFSLDQITSTTGCPRENVEANWPKIVDQLVLAGINRREIQRAVIPTIAIETASTFLPVEEAFWMPQSYRDALPYAPFWGRGFNQRTHQAGYAKAGPAIADLWSTSPDQPTFDLVAHPENLLDADLAAADLACFWRDTRALATVAWPGGYSLQDAAAAGDTEWLRRLVQGGTAGLERFRLIYVSLGSDRPSDPPVVPSVVTLNRAYPPILQNDPWSCWPTSARWLLGALGADADGDGQPPTEAYVESQAIRDGIVSMDDGLLVASAGPGAAWLNEQWLSGMGIEAVALQGISYDRALRLASEGGLLLGGSRWNHWTAVADVSPTELVLANPAPNWQGVGSVLSREEWASWGPWNAISVPVVGDAQEDPAVIAELQAQLAAVTAERDHFITVIAVIADDKMDVVQHTVNEVRQIREESIGPRPVTAGVPA